MALDDAQNINAWGGHGREDRLVASRTRVGTLASDVDAKLLRKGTLLDFDEGTGLWMPTFANVNPGLPDVPAGAVRITATAPGASGYFNLGYALGGYSYKPGVAIGETAASQESQINSDMAGTTNGRDLVNSGEYHIDVLVGTTLDVVGTVWQVTLSGNAATEPTFSIDYAAGTWAPTLPTFQTGGATTLNPPSSIPAKVRGLLLDVDPLQLTADGEVQAIVMLAGEAHRDDLNTAAQRSLLGLSEADIDAALSDPTLREAGIQIRGLADVS